MDYPQWYRQASAPFRSPTAARILDSLDRGLVFIVAGAYVIMLLWLAASSDARFPKMLLVPAVTFAIVTAIRTALDAPRPYKAYDIDPILKKDRMGKSFPSRHVSSAAIIAFALAWVNPALGIAAFIACAIVCFTRIIGGVHFPRDVIAAVAIALLCGFIGFFALP